jgi:hypothetical protein
MTAEIENLILEHLGQVREDIAGMKSDVREINERLGILEVQYASVSGRIDRIDSRIERIERRLELTEA